MSALQQLRSAAAQLPTCPVARAAPCCQSLTISGISSVMDASKHQGAATAKIKFETNRRPGIEHGASGTVEGHQEINAQRGRVTQAGIVVASAVDVSPRKPQNDVRLHPKRGLSSKIFFAGLRPAPRWAPPRPGQMCIFRSSQRQMCIFWPTGSQIRRCDEGVRAYNVHRDTEIERRSPWHSQPLTCTPAMARISSSTAAPT